MTSWALSAHLGLQKIGGCFPSNEEHVIDLGSGNLPPSCLGFIIT